MKRTWLITGALSAGLVLMETTAAFAGEWKQDANGWWWQNDDGTYPVSRWEWLDGNQDQIAECYYFDESGYLMTNTLTPDNCTVNANGEWVYNGLLQTRPAGRDLTGEGDVESDLEEEGDAENDHLEADAAKEDFAAARDFAAGKGAVRDVDILNRLWLGELSIDRTIGKNFIKQPFVDCIGRYRSEVERILGVEGEPEKTEDYAADEFDFHINYLLSDHEDVRIDYKNNIAVRIFGTNTELLNFEKDEYSLSEIDAILGIEHETLSGDAHFWHLQHDPDVIIELVDGYASLYAY